MRHVRVFLVHGTWGAGADWKNIGSPFRASLKEALTRPGREVDFDSISWGARNSGAQRAQVAESLIDKLATAERTDEGKWEYLVVAHSHGGNIATHAVRERLRNSPNQPILGVVCLNTPFLKHELRAWGNYIIAWLVLMLILALAVSPWIDPLALPMDHAVQRVYEASNGWLNRDRLGAALIVLALILLGLVMLGKQLRLKPPHQSQSEQGTVEPRPKVLCLSCPDDEAITFLGLLEGIANLPQLLLHPIGIVALSLGLTLYMLLTGHTDFCAADLACWASNLYLFTCSLVTWVAIALLGGFIGSVIVVIAFGLPSRGLVENLLSRVLVSYVPLQSAETYFRGISEVKHKWLSPLQLLHSQIYRSEQTFGEIRAWLNGPPFSTDAPQFGVAPRAP